jgi:hypothetical protein
MQELNQTEIVSEEWGCVAGWQECSGIVQEGRDTVACKDQEGGQIVRTNE